MTDLVDRRTDCTLAIPDPPTNDGTTSRSDINLVATDLRSRIPQDPSHTNGWDYTDDSRLRRPALRSRLRRVARREQRLRRVSSATSSEGGPPGRPRRGCLRSRCDGWGVAAQGGGGRRRRRDAAHRRRRLAAVAAAADRGGAGGRPVAALRSGRAPHGRPALARRRAVHRRDRLPDPDSARRARDRSRSARRAPRSAWCARRSRRRASTA